MILNEKYVSQKNVYFLFITNRLLRIYPLYFIILIITLSTYLLDNNSPYLVNLRHYQASFAPSTNIYLIVTHVSIIGQDIALFLGIDLASGKLFFTENFKNTQPFFISFLAIGQAWTIGLEILYYLIAPFIVRRKNSIILLLILLSLSLRIFIYYGLKLKFDPWTYRFFPTELIYFLLGTLIYRGYVLIKKQAISANFQYLTAGFTLLFTLFYSNILWSFTDRLAHTSIHAFYLISFIIALPFLFLLTRNWNFDRTIGELSYPIYLSHGVIIYLTKNMINHRLVAVVVGSIIFSWILNELISKKIETYRQNRITKV
jgi:peptidoglycan/LPS O-acetylase OafA/YrhL